VLFLIIAIISHQRDPSLPSRIIESRIKGFGIRRVIRNSADKRNDVQWLFSYFLFLSFFFFLSFFLSVHAQYGCTPNEIEDPWVIGNSKPIQNWLFDRWNVTFNSKPVYGCTLWMAYRARGKKNVTSVLSRVSRMPCREWIFKSQCRELTENVILLSIFFQIITFPTEKEKDTTTITKVLSIHLCLKIRVSSVNNQLLLYKLK